MRNIHFVDKDADYRTVKRMKRSISCLIARTAAWVMCALSTPSVLAADTQDPIGHFEITRYEVQGNTLLAQTEINQLLAPFTGKERDFGSVQRALEALEAAYRKRGFNVVQVILPEQELNQGVVHFQVIQPKLGKIIVEGNRFFDDANIRRSLPALRTGETPNIGSISSSLKLANENPAKKTNLQLQTGDTDDQINATLKVIDDKPWRVGGSLDNTGNKTTGETQISTFFQHANVGGLDHVMSLQYTTSVEKPNQVRVYGAGYHMPLYGLGDSVDLFASYSDVDSGSVLAGIFDLQVSGKGSLFGARYNHNLQRKGDYEAKLIYGIDYKLYKNNVTLQNIQLGNDLAVHPLTAGYIGTWTLPRGELNVSVAAFQNISGGSHGGTADFNRVRAGAPANYNLIRYGATYNRVLQKDWLMRLNLSGQYAHDALVPGEQLGAGGANSVRGFLERDISGDSGAIINAEIYTPSLCAQVQNSAAQCRALAFYDAARMTRNSPLPGESASASIGSIGVGMRIGVGKNLTMQMDLGHVVDAGLSKDKGDNRLHFRLNLSY